MKIIEGICIGIAMFLMVFSNLVSFACGKWCAADDLSERLRGKKPLDDYWRQHGVCDWMIGHRPGK